MIHMDKMKGVHGIIRVNFCETKQNMQNLWKFSDTKISWYTVVFRPLQFDSLFLTHTHLHQQFLSIIIHVLLWLAWASPTPAPHNGKASVYNVSTQYVHVRHLKIPYRWYISRGKIFANFAF